MNVFSFLLKCKKLYKCARFLNEKSGVETFFLLVLRATVSRQGRET